MCKVDSKKQSSVPPPFPAGSQTSWSIYGTLGVTQVCRQTAQEIINLSSVSWGERERRRCNVCVAAFFSPIGAEQSQFLHAGLDELYRPTLSSNRSRSGTSAARARAELPLNRGVFWCFFGNIIISEQPFFSLPFQTRYFSFNGPRMIFKLSQNGGCCHNTSIMKLDAGANRSNSVWFGSVMMREGGTPWLLSYVCGRNGFGHFSSTDLQILRLSYWFGTPFINIWINQWLRLD